MKKMNFPVYHPLKPQRTISHLLFGDKLLALLISSLIVFTLIGSLWLIRERVDYNRGYKAGYMKGAEIYGWEIPSVRQLQERLVDAGFEIVVDGKLGSETKNAWDKSYINQVVRSWVDINMPGVEVWKRRQFESEPLAGNPIEPAISP